MSDILATHRRLLAAGLSEDQSRSFLRLVADAEGGGFDGRAVQDHFAAAPYSAAHVLLLVEILLERFARKVGGST
jgi:hypothetical protein